MLNWIRWHWQLVLLFVKVSRHRKLLSEVFDNLDEDDGRRYHLELRRLKQKIAKYSKRGTLTKPMLLRNEFFNVLNSQQEEFFEENLEVFISMMASWFIKRKSEVKKDVDIDDSLDNTIEDSIVEEASIDSEEE